MSIDNRPLRWIAPLVWQIAPPQEGFILTPEQHRRRATDLRDAGRPDLAQHHGALARTIEHRRQRMQGLQALQGLFHPLLTRARGKSRS